LTDENRVRLKNILPLLDRDVKTLIQDVDQIRDLIELIDQEIPSDLKAVLEFSDRSAAIKRVNRNIAARSALLGDRALKKHKAKDLHSHIRAAKTSLATLQPKLKAMEDRKAELEAELAQLNSDIQIHKNEIADLPRSIEVAKKEITVTIKEAQQLKAKLTKMQGSEENDQKLLADVNRIKTDAVIAIKHYLNL
jgi:chromosome segregation ATPase